MCLFSNKGLSTVKKTVIFSPLKIHTICFMLLVNTKWKTMTNRHFSLFLAISFSSLTNFSHAQVEKTVKLIFAGDIMVHQGQLESAVVKKEKTYNFADCFQYIRPVLNQADLVIGNLELTLPGEPPYAGYPTFRSPDNLATELRQAGFDLLVTANNHSNDAKLQGLVHTIDALDGARFYHTGTFQSQEERDAFYPLVIYKKGLKLVFLNYTYGTNDPSDYPPAIINKIEEDLIREDLAEAKAQQPDAIIVLMHWGKQYIEQEREAEQMLAAKLFDWGATLVIGAHPHVVQSIKTKHNPSNTKLVAYSIGNFISGQVKPNTDGGILLEVELTKKDRSPIAYISDYAFIPIWRYIHKSKKRTYMTLPITPFEQENALLKMSAYDRGKMIRYAKYIRKKMKSFDCKERKITLQEIQME
jgi:poly-gamma-glutamate capsule biosynthesis protein CapA/YwtB (metallophosphatase superfamily)